MQKPKPRDPTSITPTVQVCTPTDDSGRGWPCVGTLNNIVICGKCNVPNENYGCNPDVRPYLACCGEADCSK